MKEFRTSLGMTQNQFADHFTIPVRTLQEWEQGRRTPPSYVVSMMKKIIKLEKERENELHNLSVASKQQKKV